MIASIRSPASSFVRASTPIVLSDFARINTLSSFGICPPILKLSPLKRFKQNSSRKASKMSYNKHIFAKSEDKENAFKDLASSGWTRLTEREAVKKNFGFENFKEAFSFMTRVAFEAEKLDHHPEWFNVYNKVDITLASHFCNGISGLDVILAGKIDEIYKRHS